MTLTATGDRLEVHPSPAADVHEDGRDAAADQPGVGESGVAEIQASGRPTFTITDAAAACSVSRKTITRKLPELAGHGAAKDDDGVWRIPVEALLAVGLHPGRSRSEVAGPPVRPITTAPAPVRPTDPDTVTIPRDRWDDVRIRLARAEAEAAERGLALADARLALRALTAGPAASRAASAPQEVPASPTTDQQPYTDAGGAQGRTAPVPGHRDQDASSSGQDTAPAAPSPAPTSMGDSPAGTSTAATAPEITEVVPADIVAARNLAARTGGYVPAGTTPSAKKRRWWQSR